jgi:hypothetical protein
MILQVQAGGGGGEEEMAPQEAASIQKGSRFVGTTASNSLKYLLENQYPPYLTMRQGSLYIILISIS